MLTSCGRPGRLDFFLLFSLQILFYALLLVFWWITQNEIDGLYVSLIIKIRPACLGWSCIPSKREKQSMAVPRPWGYLVRVSLFTC